VEAFRETHCAPFGIVVEKFLAVNNLLLAE